jgi:hypothetical protein
MRWSARQVGCERNGQQPEGPHDSGQKRPLLVLLVAITAALGLTVAAVTPASAHGWPVAYLHHGACGAPFTDQGEELGTLGYVTPLPDPTAATPVGPYASLGANDAFVTVLLNTTVAVSLNELIIMPYAIDVHLVDTDMGVDIPLTCGNVGGVRSGDQLVFGLQSTQAADTAGIAWLQADGTDTTRLRLFVTQGLAAGGYGAVGTPTP